MARYLTSPNRMEGAAGRAPASAPQRGPRGRFLVAPIGKWDLFVLLGTRRHVLFPEFSWGGMLNLGRDREPGGNDRVRRLPVNGSGARGGVAGAGGGGAACGAGSTGRFDTSEASFTGGAVSTTVPVNVPAAGGAENAAVTVCGDLLLREVRTVATAWVNSLLRSPLVRQASPMRKGRPAKSGRSPRRRPINPSFFLLFR